MAASSARAATTQLDGVGSSFAAPAIEEFTNAVQAAPYDLNVNYTSAGASGSQVPDSAVPLGSYTPGTPFSSGQIIKVVIPANSVLPPDGFASIYECADPGGLPANDPTPTSADQCDPESIQADTVQIQSDGSVDYEDYGVLSLPNTDTGPNGLGESPGGTPICDTTHECVLLISGMPTFGMLPTLSDQLAGPHYFSQPFQVAPDAGDTGVDPGDGTPETPYALALPVLAFGLIGAAIVIRRRKSPVREELLNEEG
jgi:hypothetical protein